MISVIASRTSVISLREILFWDHHGTLRNGREALKGAGSKRISMCFGPAPFAAATLSPRFDIVKSLLSFSSSPYSTVTDFARFFGLSMSQPFSFAA